MARPGMALLAHAPLGDLFTWDWTDTQPAGLTLSRSGTILCVDDAAQSHLTSFGADTWDYEINAGGNPRIWVVKSYGNTFTAPRDYQGGHGNWLAGTAAFTSAGNQDGPDGSSLTGDWVSATSAQFGHYHDVGSGQTVAYSGWGRSSSGTSTWQCGLWATDGSTRLAGFATTVTTTWQRQAAASAGVQYTIPVDGRFPSATANSVVVDCQMRLTGEAATIAISAGGALVVPYTDGTAGGKILSRAGSDLVGASGYYDVSLRGVISLLNESDLGADAYVLYLDASNHLRVRASDDKWVLTIGGSAVVVSSYASPAGAQDLDEIRVWHRADECGFHLGAGAGVGGPWSAAAQAPIAVPTTAYLFSDGSDGGIYPVQLYGSVESGALCVARNV